MLKYLLLLMLVGCESQTEKRLAKIEAEVSFIRNEGAYIGQCKEYFGLLQKVKMFNPPTDYDVSLDGKDVSCTLTYGDETFGHLFESVLMDEKFQHKITKLKSVLYDKEKGKK